MKLLLVSLYFPPAGGGGVQRPLKFAQYLPALGIETHVLAPDNPKWIHEDAELRVPTQAWVHRARYIGPKGRKPAEELHGKHGLGLALTYARLASRRLLVPDENVSWNLTAIPAAIRIVRDMLGATSGLKATPGTIRGDFSSSRQMNLVHASDGPEASAREIELYFKSDELHSYGPTLTPWFRAEDEK